MNAHENTEIFLAYVSFKSVWFETYGDAIQIPLTFAEYRNQLLSYLTNALYPNGLPD